MSHTFAPSGSQAIQLHVIWAEGCDDWLSDLSPAHRKWAQQNGFKASSGNVLAFPAGDGSAEFAAVGLGKRSQADRCRFVVGGARTNLPKGNYVLRGDLDAVSRSEAALGWLLAGYRFGKYRDSDDPDLPDLVVPDGVDAGAVQSAAQAEFLARDLINIPANDMGPDQLEQAARDLAKKFGAKINVTKGDDLLGANLPLVHAVGRAAHHAPRLIDLTWGSKGPCLVLVGKGVCFDTGGLNIKPGASMGLMKKDMGGAANVLAVARMIMDRKLPIKLRVLIPAVENAISGQAFRPGDILPSRKGLSVEINNTDAEGRLVLADALTLADEGCPDLVVSMATLTGAARVAVGPDLAPFYATDDRDADVLAKAAANVRDPVWRLPFWDPYEPMIEPGIADLDNAPKGGQAGSITAALFLRRFVTDTARYVHFDIYGWQPAAAPARPKGGVGQGYRALFEALPAMLSL